MCRQKLKQLLEARLLELDALLTRGEQRQQNVELDQAKVGRLSRMDALQQQAMQDAVKERATQEKVRIQLALKRIEADEYGWCRYCDEEILIARLEIDPTITLCFDCASKLEQG